MKTFLFSIFLLLPFYFSVSGFAGTCVTSECHQGLVRTPYVHQPVAEQECSGCHVQKSVEHPLKSGKSFTLTEKGERLCYQCHDALNVKKMVHDPVEEGDCLGCHRPHGSDGPHLLDVKEDQKALCGQCHDEETAGHDYVHGPAALGACTGCHDPHESDEKSLLRQETNSVCFSCHSDFADGIKSAQTIHAPIKDQECTLCHQAHSGAYPHLLKEKMPDICVKCHEKIGLEYKNAKTKHAALFIRQKCGNCHVSHFSNTDNLNISATEIDLCLTCHGKDDYSKSDALRNIKKELEGKKDLHGPIKEKRCVVCHDPHGSDNFRLLTGPYPVTFYADYKKDTYEFCLKCHEKILLFPDTSIYTNFRNGKQNLHYLHVARRKGRTCKACHEPHASNWPKLINDKGAPFGSWRIPIRFVLTKNGGSCAPGCHGSKKYDRQDPVLYKKSLEETGN
ncbi:MAG: cytochrome C [Deltaproteobacteria bacterium]|nr:cytochrome C [Deltaproteobacteria bacterium]